MVPHATAAAASRLAALLGRTALAHELSVVAFGLAWRDLDPFPGYTGRPALARAEIGRIFGEKIVDAYEALVADVLIGRAPSPTPVLEWMLPLTLGGRLAV